MRRGLVLLTPLMLSAAAVAAQTQVGVMRGGPVLEGAPVIRGDQIVSSKPEAVVARVTSDEIVSRLLSFDRDRDGKLAMSELTERMQPLMARGDKNRDGLLDAKEIVKIATAPAPSFRPEQEQGGGPPLASRYGFADEAPSFSSRDHIEGALDDLKLDAEVKKEARSIAMTFVDRVEADAEADLVRDLNGVLTPQQVVAVQEELRNRQRTIAMNRSDEVLSKRFVASASVSMQSNISQFRLSPDKRLLAQKAVDRYAARVKLNDTAHGMLVGQMSGLLDEEERDNLRAALVRRPLVEKDGAKTVARAQGNLVDMATAAGRVRATTPPSPEPVFGTPTIVRNPKVGR